MEFPAEILAIIRDFARPCFKYFKLYNMALRVHHKKHWPELKGVLMNSPHSLILPLFNLSFFHDLYMESCVKFENGIDEYDILDKQCKLHRAKETLLSILQ